jgi:L-ascorbate metabolism protein UlaG (beta-lactamase superfamily)
MTSLENRTAIIVVGTLMCSGAFSQVTVQDLEVHNPPGPDADGIAVTWMGITNLIISDGETTLITDGFFTRVPADPESGMIEPNRPVIEAALDDLGVDDAAAVMVVHSHFDHALDAPVVAELTGATLLGSESTANIGRGLQLPEEQIRVIEPGEPMHYGDFSVTFFVSKHWLLPNRDAAVAPNQTIDEPLVPPASLSAYKLGEAYSILLEHPKGNVLIQGSAGYMPGALDGVQADVVLLGTGGLGDLPPGEQEDYFREIVTVTGAKSVYPIHWEFMWTPLSEPFRPDTDFDRTMGFLEKKKQETGVTYGLLPKGEAVLLTFE